MIELSLRAYLRNYSSGHLPKASDKNSSGALMNVINSAATGFSDDNPQDYCDDNDDDDGGVTVVKR